MTYTLRELQPWDASALSVFACSVRPRDFEVAVEESIRRHLADEVRDGGEVQTVAAWSGHELCAVAAWQPHTELPSAWFVNVIAVASGHRQQGLGALLKRTILQRAHDAGVTVLVSVVHVDNHAMQNLNVALGGTAQAIPGDWTHRYWLVPVP